MKLMLGLVFLFQLASAESIWSCSSDQRYSGGDYHAVSIERNGTSLLKLVYSYAPSTSSQGVGGKIERSELISDLRCRFHSDRQAYIQCVSYNFLNSIETVPVEDELALPTNQKWNVKIKSGRDISFIVDLAQPNSACGF